MCRQLSCLILVGPVLTMCGVLRAQDLGRGNILFEYWWDGGINNNLDNLVKHPDFPHSPGASEWRQRFSRPDLPYTNYLAVRTRGYLIPPENGYYTFWIASDDDGELWLSTDEDPANATMIASVEGWTSYLNWAGDIGDPGDNQRSAPVTLAGGQRYYIEALFSDGTGAGHLGVAWAGPGIGDNPVVIEGEFLTPFIRDRDPLLLAQNPSPPDGAVDIAPLSFKWQPRVTGITHDVYFGTNPEPGPVELVGRQSFSEYVHVMPLKPGATYYWRVDEVLPDGTIVEGSVWSFTVRPEIAWNPRPADRAQSVNLSQNLTWDSGTAALFHTVYFGESFDEVEGATTGGRVTADAVYDPGFLQPGTTYYWRVDEFLPSGTSKGEVWSFTTVDPFVFVFDDFEDYSHPTDRWEVVGGALVGHPTTDGPRVMETRPDYVYSGKQSMPLYYSNPKLSDYSQADYILPKPLDLTVGGKVNAYRLHVRGKTDNSPAPLYVAITDDANRTAVVYHPDPEVTATTCWQTWTIPLSEFAPKFTLTSVNVRAIKKISIGVGKRGDFTAQSKDTIHVASGGSQGSVACDDQEGTGGLLPVNVQGYVRDIFTAERITRDSNCMVTLKHVDTGEEEASDDTNLSGYYFMQPDPGTYLATGTADGFPEVEDHTVQVNLCCDTRRDFLLRRGPAPDCPIYRFLSPRFLDKSNCFCTADVSETTECLRSESWTYNGIAFCTVVEGTPNAEPVRRFRSKFKGTFFYTIDPNKTETFTSEDNKIVWECEKATAFWAYPENKQPNDAQAVYDYWSPSLECHFYTVSNSADPNTWANADEPVEFGPTPWWTAKDDWQNEGVAWYVPGVPQQ